jgi:hypothetical protein
LAKSQHVVVDGSNLATEGRTLPSLAQLDEAVRTFAEEHPGSIITVVVDASFEHRIDESEREIVREAMLNGELVSPPAGAIGRGDAFVLRIAERTGAMVLSNDSFQEFHGQHPWLFDDGRLIGGKPVPGVGWIFTPRLPIRGPKSRAATELAKATKKVEKRGRGRAAAAPAVDASWPLTPATPPPARKADRVLTSAIEEAVAEAIDPQAPVKSTKKKAAAKAMAADKVTKTAKKAATKKQAATKATAPAKKVAAKKDAGKKAAAPKKEAPAKKAAGTKKAASTKKAVATKPTTRPEAPAREGKSRQAPPPAVNAPLVFINFVAAYPVGSTVQGTVVSFTSHGAMVDVEVPDSGALHCYIPLSAMGTPPPTKARQMLTKGELRPFVLAGLDPPRRVAELALPAPPAKKRRSPAKKAAKASS